MILHRKAILGRGQSVKKARQLKITIVLLADEECKPQRTVGYHADLDADQNFHLSRDHPHIQQKYGHQTKGKDDFLITHELSWGLMYQIALAHTNVMVSVFVDMPKFSVIQEKSHMKWIVFVYGN